MIKRCGYILTLDPQSERAIFSKNILEKIGFNVILVKPILDTDKFIKYFKIEKFTSIITNYKIERKI
jgi:hypothetical protein